MTGIIILYPDGRVEVRRTAEILDLHEMQEIVGGYIEMAGTILPDTEDGITPVMVVNEEGKISELAENELAYDIHDNWRDPIVGTAVLCGAENEELVGLGMDYIDNICDRFLEVQPWRGE